jgi:hypothetical protein
VAARSHHDDEPLQPCKLRSNSKTCNGHCAWPF